MGISERWLLTNNVAVEETTADACFSDGPLPIVLVDLVTGERRVIAEEGFDDAAISRDGRYLAATEPDFSKAYVLEIETGRRVLEIDPASTGQLNSFVRGLSHDGGMLLYGDRPMQTWDVPEGRVVASLGGTSGESFSAAFALEGETVYASTRDGVLRRYDARTGAELLSVPAVGGGHASLSGSGISLVLDEATRTSSVVDERPTGEIDTFRPDCRLFTGAGTLHVVDATAAFATQCQVLPTIIAETFVLDVPALRVRHVLPGLAAQVLALSKDGTRIAQQEYQDGAVSSPIRIRDTSTGTLVVELEGVCTWDQQGLSRDLPAGCEEFPTTPFRLWTTNMAWSPDGRYVAAVHEFFPDPGYLAVWDAGTGRLLHTEATPEELTFQDVVFSPDSRRLIWFTGDFGDRGEVETLSTDDWSRLERLELPAEVEGAGRIGFAGFLADGTLSAVSNMAGNGGGWLIRLDAKTFGLLDSDRAHEGAPKATATSPDGSLVATGASDGVVRVWDGPTGRLVHELAVEGQAQGVAFLGDDHLAVTPHGGGLLVFTLDRAELVDIVAGSLTRGFTEAECERFGFGDACPSLDELRAGTMPTGRDP
jgi:WD40 repeat protein